MIDVVAAIIFNEGNILLARRALHKSLAGKWELPGGKIELNESPEAALKRELKEEFNISIRVNEHFKTVEHKYDNFSIRLISYYAEYLDGEFILTDHDLYAWVEVSKLYDYDLAEADKPIADDLVKSS